MPTLSLPAPSTGPNWLRWLVLLATLCAFASKAQAQWATTVVDHDWRVTVGTNSYGLQQRTVYTVAIGVGGTRTTTLYFGRHTTTTDMPAVALAALVLLPTSLGAFLLVSKMVCGAPRSRTEGVSVNQNL